MIGSRLKVDSLHTWIAVSWIDGFGFTVIVNIEGAVEHVMELPEFDGVTVIVPTIAAEVLFDTWKDGIFPVPDPASPIEVLSLTQLNWVPGIVLVKITSDVNCLSHKSWFEIGPVVGLDITVIDLVAVL